MNKNSFGARATLPVDGHDYSIYKLEALEKRGFSLAKTPFSIKVLLENLLRREDGLVVNTDQVETLARWNGTPEEREFSFRPARVLLQDFTGIPVVADLAAMRDAIKRLGGDPAKINPLQPVDLVIDHSVQVDSFGTADVVRDERAHGIRAQPGTLPVPALGAGRVQQLPRSAARHRDRPPGESRIPGAGGASASKEGEAIPTR